MGQTLKIWISVPFGLTISKCMVEIANGMVRFSVRPMDYSATSELPITAHHFQIRLSIDSILNYNKCAYNEHD